MNFKKILVLLFLLFLCSGITADSVAPFTPTFVKLGEKASVVGIYNSDNNAFVLCRFVAYDSNTIIIDRWSDEYTFSDGTFSAEKVLTEPPYFRGDLYYIITTCGSSSAITEFTVIQPTSLAQPIQKGWEYLFDQSNLDALMFLGTFVALIVIVIFVFVFLIKKGGSLAG